MCDDREPQHNQQVDPEPHLARFAPVPLAIDRDRLMFLAGRADALAEAASIRPARASFHAWPWLTLLSTAAALVMAVLLWQKPSERVIVVERAAVEKEPVQKEIAIRSSPPQPQQSNMSDGPNDTAEVAIESRILGQGNYVLWRERVLREGVDVLAQAHPTSSENIAPPATQRELLQEFYGPAATRQPNLSPRGEWWNQWLYSGDRS